MDSVNEKMTLLANAVRELSGIADKLNIDGMTVNVGEANTEVSTQADLIAQIAKVVDELPEAGNTVSSDLKIAYMATSLGGFYSNIIVFNQDMTWADFCNSEYNIRYWLNSGTVESGVLLSLHNDNSIWDSGNHGYRVASAFGFVTGSDKLIEGHLYRVYYDD